MCTSSLRGVRWRYRAATVAALLGIAGGTSFAVQPTLDNPDPRAVSGVAAARRFFDLASSRRVDICQIGDSNSRSQVISGHEDGMGRAFSGRFGMYATRVNPVMSIDNWGAFILAESSLAGGPFAVVTDQNCPPAAGYAFQPQGMPKALAYLAPGLSTPFGYNLGHALGQDNPLGVNAHLRWHLSEFVLQAGQGSMGMEARALWPGSAFDTYAFRRIEAGDRQAAGIADRAMDVPAGIRSPHGILFCVSSLVRGVAAVGPLALTYSRVERPDRSTGIAYSPLWQQGGRSARHVLEDVANHGGMPVQMREYLRQLVRLQNDPPVLLVHIMHGGNDILDSAPSRGPIGGLPSSTPAGFRDNIDGIMAFVRESWTSAGHDPQRVFFLLGPYHPRGVQEDVQAAFAQVWRDIAAADPQTFSVDGLALTTATELQSRSFLASPSDPFHLSVAGFQAFGRATVSAISRAVCPADVNENGERGVEDIFVFLERWFGREPGADFNHDGGIAIDDIFTLLGAWFQGC